MVTGGALSPTGKRAVFEARGDIFTVPAEKGDVRNLTASSGAADRAPAWSPDGERISWFGPQAELDAPDGCPALDAQGGCVIPGLIDCHTHTVFAGTREREFVQRLEGRSYAEIAESGGGIRVTVEAVRNASCEELVELALPRLNRMLERGVTTDSAPSR